MKTIAFTPAADRDLRKLDATARRDVLADLTACAEDDTDHEVARLGGVDALRMRVGEWRVIFRETAGRITVLAVQHRSVVYRRLGHRK